VRRVIAVDPGFDRGAAEEFFVAYEAMRPGGDPKAARVHFDRALALSGGTRASLYVSFAEGISVATQNRAEFRRLLSSALAISPDADPAQRLATTLAQRRARWLEGRIEDLFLDEEGPRS
jgi:predicted anti-sigma-YlaC factor YlaD